MIADTYENRERYSELHPDWNKAFQIIQGLIGGPIPEGANIKETIDGMQLRMQTYLSKNEDEKQFEAHRRCVDIQYIVEGREVIYWTKTDRLKVTVPYSAERDHMSLMPADKDDSCPLYLSKGYFAVFFPGDAHKTQCRWGESEKVVKIIIKLPLYGEGEK